jgi:hypothetical protein
MNKKNFFSLKDCTKGRMMRKLLPWGNRRRKCQFETLHAPAKITVKQNREERSVLWVLESWSKKGWSKHIVLIGCLQSFAPISATKLRTLHVTENKCTHTLLVQCSDLQCPDLLYT